MIALLRFVSLLKRTGQACESEVCSEFSLFGKGPLTVTVWWVRLRTFASCAVSGCSS